MSLLDLTGCKKRKRGEGVFKFKTFGEQGHPLEFNDCSFRQNVKTLLDYGQLETGSRHGTPCWSFQLEVHRHPPLHILLFVVEEQIEFSLQRHCKHCQYVGWGNHMICNKKYHFLVPSKDTVMACLSYEGSCDEADSATGKFNLIQLQGHILHGVFHSNGFGHLLCINGAESGSDLAGHQVMEFWDRLCAGLRARKVSLNDYSQKVSIDLRLIHGVAYGGPWFGRWGYKFGRGSYGVTQQMYQKAIEAIRNVPLQLLTHHLGCINNEIAIIFARYQMLSANSLVTLGDLFCFMLELKSKLPKENSIDSYNPGILVDTNCRWSSKRVEMATRVIVEALKRAEFRWISRQEVRDAARAYIGDTGLLDFVLKSLGNHIVGNYLVRRCLNPVTKVLEYCLEDISNAFPHQQGYIANDSKIRARYKITKAQLMKDLFYLHKHVLKEQKLTMNMPMLSTIPIASRIILDTKYFVKDYSEEMYSKINRAQGDKPMLYCSIVVTKNEGEKEGPEVVMEPDEVIMLRKNATLDELMLEVEKNFKEIYWGLSSLVVQSIANLKLDGSELVFKQVKSGGTLVFEGINGVRDGINETILEGFASNYVVDCSCGTKDDDGERMVSCDICEVWQHTRCVRIPNNEEIPNIFLCNKCEQDILLLPSLP